MAEELSEQFKEVQKICEAYAREKHGDKTYVVVSGSLPQRKLFECYKEGDTYAFAFVSAQENLAFGGKPNELVNIVDSFIKSKIVNPCSQQ